MREPEATLPYGLPDDVPIEHDPLDPHPEIPTPIELVNRLTLPQRELRVERLTVMARDRFHEAFTTYGIGEPVVGRTSRRYPHGRPLGTKAVVGVCSLVSGGNDSYTVAHLFRDVTTHHVHANTETGIEATRAFVRQTAAAWGLPLIERTPPPGEGYFDLVLGRVYARERATGDLVLAWPGGFPGPAAHAVMQQRLKGRCLEQVPHALGVSGSLTGRVVFIAGRRRSESKRRATVPHHEERGTIIWSSPIAVWHKADLRAYRLMHGIDTTIGRCPRCGCSGVPVNPVSEVLGMSGECGCLANAVEGEPARWRAAYPDEPFIRRVDEAERILAGPGYEHVPARRKLWGWGGSEPDPDEVVPMGTDALCGVNCGPDPLLDLMDPLFDLSTLR